MNSYHPVNLIVAPDWWDGGWLDDWWGSVVTRTSSPIDSHSYGHVVVVTGASVVVVGDSVVVVTVVMGLTVVVGFTVVVGRTVVGAVWHPSYTQAPSLIHISEPTKLSTT